MSEVHPMLEMLGASIDDAGRKKSPEVKLVRRVSVLDSQKSLIGVRELLPSDAKHENELDLDPGDLPLDGTYKWHSESGSFLPLGHGFPKITGRPPIPEDMALFLLIQALASGSQIPQQCLDWSDWYTKNVMKREEEHVLRRRRRAGRR